MDFEERLAAYWLGIFRDADLPAIALQGLMQGHDSPALAALAGESLEANSFELRAMLARALRELEITQPPAAESRALLLNYWLREIAFGAEPTLHVLRKFVRGYFDVLRSGPDSDYAGKSDGVDGLVSICWEFEDLSEGRALSIAEMKELSDAARSEAQVALRRRT